MGAYTFVDLMSQGPEPPIKVRAMLSLLRVDEGGWRSAGIRSGYRPSHNFDGPENRRFYIGQIDFDTTDLINLGESLEVVVKFLRGPGLVEVLKVGATGRVQERPKLVATATVLEVLDGT